MNLGDRPILPDPFPASFFRFIKNILGFGAHSLLSATIFLVLAFAISGVLFVTKNWFGPGDLRGFGFWSAILSVYIGLATAGCARLVTQWNSFPAYLLVSITAVVLADISDHIVFRMVGAWYYAFGFTALFCWVPAAFITSVVVTRLIRRSGDDTLADARKTSSGAPTLARYGILAVVATGGILFDHWKRNADLQWIINELGPSDRPAKLEDNESYLFEDAARRIYDLSRNHEPAALVAAETAMRAFALAAPQSERVSGLEQTYLVQLEKVDATAAQARVEKLLTSSNPKLIEIAQGWKRRWAATQKPLELKFTAVDGREVDLAKLRGKVVLLDFWATWCGPCIGEMPNVVATYRRHRDEGFEVIGVCLDFADRRANVVRFTKAGGMTWPQYYDGKGFKGQWPVGFAILSIPTAWLIDKNGVVVNRDARGEKLESEVTRLLAH